MTFSAGKYNLFSHLNADLSTKSCGLVELHHFFALWTAIRDIKNCRPTVINY